MDLGLKLKQSLSISPQAITNLEILQMGSHQLLEYIQQMAEENPTVELDDSYTGQTEDEQFRLKLQWLREADTQNKVYYKYDSDAADPMASVSVNDDTLSGHLVSQIGESPLPPRLKRAAEFVALNLNNNGYLTDSPEVLAAASGLTIQEIEQAISFVQSLDPPGVAAKDLRSCLLFQLRAMGEEAGLASRIVSDYLPQMASKSVSRLAALLGESVEATAGACEIIRSLNPRPSSGFAAEESTVYITPDVVVVSFPDHFELLTNDYYFPTVKINSYYLDMLGTTTSDEVKKYLTGKLRQTRLAMGAIEQRKSMLLRCAEEIVKRQELFFRGGSLVPMTMSELSQALEVHESTVSRAVRDKFLQCSRGVFPLSRFFSRAVGNGEVSSPDGIRSLIEGLIAAEDPAHPLSDNDLAARLAASGVEISRRTVAKYRSQLGIGSAAMRRGR